MDERYYPNPQQYEPWRFSRARDQLAIFRSGSGSGSDSTKENSTDDDKPNGGWLSTVDERFATFGFGKDSW